MAVFVTVKVVDLISNQPLSNVNVNLDGFLNLKTNFQGIVHGSLLAGIHHFTLTHPNFKYFETRIFISEQPEMMLEFKLEPLPPVAPPAPTPTPTPAKKTVTVQVEDIVLHELLSNATVTWAGQKVVTGWDGKASFELPATLMHDEVFYVSAAGFSAGSLSLKQGQEPPSEIILPIKSLETITKITPQPTTTEKPISTTEILKELGKVDTSPPTLAQVVAKLPELKVPDFGPVLAGLKDFLFGNFSKEVVNKVMSVFTDIFTMQEKAYQRLFTPRSTKTINQAEAESEAWKSTGNAIASVMAGAIIGGEIIGLGQLETPAWVVPTVPAIAAQINLANKVYEAEQDTALLSFYQRALNRKWQPLLPPLTDLIRFAVREVFTPEIARKFGQYEEYPDILTDYAAQQGLGEEWSKAYWAAKWDLPAAQQGFEMLHRGVITPQELTLLLRSLDVMPFWREKLTAISYNVIPRIDIRRVWDLGLISRERLVKAHLEIGLNPADAELMTKWVIADDITKDARELFKKGWISKDEFTLQLSQAGLDIKTVNTVVNKIVKADKPERTVKERDLTKAEIIKAAKKRTSALNDAVQLEDALKTAIAENKPKFELDKLSDALEEKLALIELLPDERGTLQLLQRLGYDDAESKFILAIELGVSAGSPESPSELKDLTEKWRRAVDKTADAVAVERVELERLLARAKARLKVAQLRDESDEKIAELVLAVDVLVKKLA